jgi:RNA polymerase sigma-70 factor (ECF subfamily)
MSRPSHKDVDDTRLIALAREGNQSAFTTLVRRYESTVWRFAYKLSRNEQTAAELFQDTFVNVYRKLHQFDGSSKFSTWLFAIVANNYRMELRKRQTLQKSLEVPAPEGFTDTPDRDQEGHKVQTIPSWRDTPLDGVMNKELRVQLDRAVVKLPEEYRTVFTLRDVEELSTEETARILKLSEAAVKSRLHRARAFLREQLHSYLKQ